MAEKLLSKCLNFQRIRNGLTDIQICKMKGIEVNCAGWSDNCKYPALFTSAEGLSYNYIDFNKIKKPMEGG